MAKAVFNFVVSLIAIALFGVTSFPMPRDVGIGSSFPEPQAKDSGNHKGWKRYELESSEGDVIGVFLPQKPEKFFGGRMNGGPGVALPVDVYLAAGNNSTYAVVFVNALPNTAVQLSDKEKSDIFRGCWMAIIGRARQAIEQQSGKTADVQGTGPNKEKVSGLDGLTEDFLVGPYPGHARMLFVGKKAYMLVGTWPKDNAKESLDAFLDHFEMRPKH